MAKTFEILRGKMTPSAQVRAREKTAQMLKNISLQEQETREALADVDAGRLVEHHAVQVWADSLCTDIDPDDAFSLR